MTWLSNFPTAILVLAYMRPHEPLKINHEQLQCAFMALDKKHLTDPTLAGAVWLSSAKSVFMIASAWALALTAFYLLSLAIYKNNNMSEKVVLMSRTLDSAIDASDWTLVHEHLDAAIAGGGLLSVQISTSKNEVISGPLMAKNSHFFPICKSFALPKHDDLKIMACTPLITTAELTIFPILLIFIISMSYLIKSHFYKTTKEITGILTDHVVAMRMALGGELKTDGPISAQFAETVELATAIQQLIDVARKNEVERTRSSLISQIVHDIRSPLTALKAVMNHASVKDLADINLLLKGAVERIENMCNTLLQTYRSQQTTKANTECVNVKSVAQIVSQLANEKSMMAAKSGDIKIICQTNIKDSDHDRVIRTDALTIQRILDNLIGNAMQAVNQSDGRIAIGCKTTSHARSVILSVADNGCGIEEADLPLIYDKLFTKNKTDGTGLGLFYVKSEVNKAGGEIHVSSKKNVGTFFKIEIPTHELHAQPVG